MGERWRAVLRGMNYALGGRAMPTLDMSPEAQLQRVAARLEGMGRRVNTALPGAAEGGSSSNRPAHPDRPDEDY